MALPKPLTSTGVGHEWIQPNIFETEMKSKLLQPLPPRFTPSRKVNPKESFASTNQILQKRSSEANFGVKRLEKAMPHQSVHYLKNFYEQFALDPYTAVGNMKANVSQNTQFSKEYVDKLSEVIADRRTFMKSWKPEDDFTSPEVEAALMKANNLCHQYESDRSFFQNLDPYLSTMQKEYRYYGPQEIEEGIGKKDAVTIYSEMGPVCQREEATRPIRDARRFLIQQKPIAADPKWFQQTCPWPKYVTLQQYGKSAMKSEMQASFNSETIQKVEVDHHQDVLNGKSIADYPRPKAPNMYRTESSYIGSNEIIII